MDTTAQYGLPAREVRTVNHSRGNPEGLHQTPVIVSPVVRPVPRPAWIGRELMFPEANPYSQMVISTGPAAVVSTEVVYDLPVMGVLRR